MSLTFLAKSSAYSWKMSFCGQVLCQRIVIGPCALATMGKPSAAAPVAATAAPVRNFRRDASGALLECLMGTPPRERGRRRASRRDVTRPFASLSRFRRVVGGGQRERDVAVVTAHGEMERTVGRDLAERLAGDVAREHREIVDLQDHVADLEAGALRRRAPDDEGDRRGARRGP